MKPTTIPSLDKGVYFSKFLSEMDIKSFWFIKDLIDPSVKGESRLLELLIKKYPNTYVMNMWQDVIAFCYYHNKSAEEGLILYLLSEE